MEESKIAMAIHSVWDKTEYITHSYTPDEIKIIAYDIKNKIPVKRIARIRAEEFNRKGDGMLKKIRQIKRSLEKGFTINEIINKKTTETYNKEPEPMNTVNFYSVEEIVIMKTDIATGEPIRQIAKRLSKEFNRPIPGLEQKLYALKKTVTDINKWNGPKLKKSAVKKVVNTPIVKEKQPADIGVEVPHGMTFEGKPKKIMLHSDHFRIYF
jgi:hypothetical protein